MQAPMTPKFRKHLADPQNASKLTEKVLLHEKKAGTFDLTIGTKNVKVRQIGVTSK